MMLIAIPIPNPHAPTPRKNPTRPPHSPNASNNLPTSAPTMNGLNTSKSKNGYPTAVKNSFRITGVYSR